VDGRPLDPASLDDLRRATVWVDPAVQLWNRSLADNLEYGSDGHGVPIGTRVAEAELRHLMEHLPEGLQTTLGEGGALVSGGEGQRVRFGRGLGRANPGLVILDEPFRGLERDRRATLLRRARDRWRNATLVCITHDISETSTFERVIVLADGRIVEDGDPATLADREDSRYRSLLNAEAELKLRLWKDPSWRTVQLKDGRIVDDCPREEQAIL
jgi:ATP-binding cassette subfamily B protein